MLYIDYTEIPLQIGVLDRQHFPVPLQLGSQTEWNPLQLIQPMPLHNDLESAI